jgi:Uma2 family endonuclease
VVQARVTRRFSVDEYDRMVEAGILREDERIELIEGEIIQMAAVGGPHVSCVIRLTDELSQWSAGRFMVSVQNPVRLGPHSEPEPDIAILRRRSALYTAGLPGPEYVLLLIEVADSSLGYDRGTKLPLYAAAGIPEVWIANLTAECVEVYRRPQGGRYLDQRVHHRGETLTPEALPDVALPVLSILG